MKMKWKANLSVACLGWAALILVGSGCARRPPALPEAAREDSIRVAQDESFDPLSVREDDLMKLPESRLKSSGETGRGKSAEESMAGKATREAAGFRVQLIATDAEMQARSLEQQALLDFPESVYLVFDPPNYKVRVGDCLTRANANDLRDRAVKMGYGNAWVVQCRVKVADR